MGLWGDLCYALLFSFQGHLIHSYGFNCLLYTHFTQICVQARPLSSVSDPMYPSAYVNRHPEFSISHTEFILLLSIYTCSSSCVRYLSEWHHHQLSCPSLKPSYHPPCSYSTIKSFQVYLLSIHCIHILLSIPIATTLVQATIPSHLNDRSSLLIMYPPPLFPISNHSPHYS